MQLYYKDLQILKYLVKYKNLENAKYDARAVSKLQLLTGELHIRDMMNLVIALRVKYLYSLFHDDTVMLYQYGPKGRLLTFNTHRFITYGEVVNLIIKSNIDPSKRPVLKDIQLEGCVFIFIIIYV